MKRKILAILASAIVLVGPTCAFDQNALFNLGADVACQTVTHGLPFNGSIDYCSTVDIDFE